MCSFVSLNRLILLRSKNAKKRRGTVIQSEGSRMISIPAPCQKSHRLKPLPPSCHAWIDQKCGNSRNWPVDSPIQDKFTMAAVALVKRERPIPRQFSAITHLGRVPSPAAGPRPACSVKSCSSPRQMRPTGASAAGRGPAPQCPRHVYMDGNRGVFSVNAVVRGADLCIRAFTTPFERVDPKSLISNPTRPGQRWGMTCTLCSRISPDYA
jgi:hypothetical protein